MSAARAPAPVLIGFAESLPAIETAWSLLEAGYPVVAFARRGRRPPLRRELPVHEIAAPERSAAAATAELASLMRRLSPRAVLPLDDAALWLAPRAAAGTAVGTLGPVGERLELALDKRIQLRAAQEAGLAVPATREWAAAAEARAEERLPVVVKPALAIAELGGSLVRAAPAACISRADLESACARLPAGLPVLTQPFVEGVGEGVFGLRGSGGVAAWSAHRRVRTMNPAGSGSSACRPADLDPTLRAGVERLLDERRWHGMFMAELLRDRSGTAWFMELNGRPWGSMALARRLGLEYPAWALRQLERPSFEPPESAPTGPLLCRHLGRELVHLLLVLRGPRSEPPPGWPSRPETLRALLRIGRRDRWYNLRPGARALFLEDALDTLRASARRSAARA